MDKLKIEPEMQTESAGNGQPFENTGLFKPKPKRGFGNKKLRQAKFA